MFASEVEVQHSSEHPLVTLIFKDGLRQEVILLDTEAWVLLHHDLGELLSRRSALASPAVIDGQLTVDDVLSDIESEDYERSCRTCIHSLVDINAPPCVDCGLTRSHDDPRYLELWERRT